MWLDRLPDLSDGSVDLFWTLFSPKELTWAFWVKNLALKYIWASITWYIAPRLETSKAIICSASLDMNKTEIFFFYPTQHYIKNNFVLRFVLHWPMRSETTISQLSPLRKVVKSSNGWSIECSRCLHREAVLDKSRGESLNDSRLD